MVFDAENYFFAYHLFPSAAMTVNLHLHLEDVNFSKKSE